jgi:hypothetical protein
MFDARLASFLSQKQGLNRKCDLSNRLTLENFGWARSVGGANIYLSLAARNGSSARQAEDDVKNDQFAEFASARGCTYFLPQKDFQLGIKCGQGFNELSAFRTAQNKLGFTEKDLFLLNEGILSVLESGEADTSEIKNRLGALVKNFGETGKKVGQTTSLSLGLLILQSLGKIRRIPVGGRLDAQNYKYCLFQNAPDVDESFSKEEAYRALATKYWQWLGFASLSHFQCFSGLSKKAVAEAVSHLKLLPFGEGTLMGTAETHDEFSNHEVPGEPEFRIISGLDSFLLGRRDLALHLTEKDASNTLFSQDQGLQDLSHNAIVDRGRIVGVWEYDVETEEIVFATVVEETDVLYEEVKRTQDFIKCELGDARSFSLDSPKSRKPSLEKIRSFRN